MRASPHPTVPCRTRRLLSTFKWEPRKGWDVLLEAYLTEFTAEDNVSIILRHNPLLLAHGKRGRTSERAYLYD